MPYSNAGIGSAVSRGADRLIDLIFAKRQRQEQETEDERRRSWEDTTRDAWFAERGGQRRGELPQKTATAEAGLFDQPGQGAGRIVPEPGSPEMSISGADPDYREAGEGYIMEPGALRRRDMREQAEIQSELARSREDEFVERATPILESAGEGGLDPEAQARAGAMGLEIPEPASPEYSPWRTDASGRPYRLDEQGNPQFASGGVRERVPSPASSREPSPMTYNQAMEEVQAAWGTMDEEGNFSWKPGVDHNTAIDAARKLSTDPSYRIPDITPPAPRPAGRTPQSFSGLTATGGMGGPRRSTGAPPSPATSPDSIPEPAATQAPPERTAGGGRGRNPPGAGPFLDRGRSPVQPTAPSTAPTGEAQPTRPTTPTGGGSRLSDEEVAQAREMVSGLDPEEARRMLRTAGADMESINRILGGP